MSQLLIDVGNSRLKWALASGVGVGAVSAQPHHGDPAAVLAGIAAQISSPPDAVWVANVSGEAAAEELQAVAHQHWRLRMNQARVIDGQNGLQLAYAQPQRLGVDRWLGMQALWTQYRQAFIVVSAGTALTFDVVDANGRHLGGVIAPGLLTMQSAVLGATRFTAEAAQNVYGEGLGVDTETCVRQGALHAVAGLIERLSARHARPDAPGVLTGGDAAILAAQLRSQAQSRWQLRPELVLEGLLTLNDRKT